MPSSRTSSRHDDKYSRHKEDRYRDDRRDTDKYRKDDRDYDRHRKDDRSYDRYRKDSRDNGSYRKESREYDKYRRDDRDDRYRREDRDSDKYRKDYKDADRYRKDSRDGDRYWKDSRDSDRYRDSDKHRGDSSRDKYGKDSRENDRYRKDTPKDSYHGDTREDGRGNRNRYRDEDIRREKSSRIEESPRYRGDDFMRSEDLRRADSYKNRSGDEPDQQRQRQDASAERYDHDQDNRKVAVYKRPPHEQSNAVVAVPSGDVVEKLSEDEWVTRRRVEVVTTKNIETRVQRQLLLEDGKVVEDSGPIISTDTTVDTSEKKDENTEHKKGAGNDAAVPEGYVAVPGGAIVSEKFTNITNTHEQRDDVREEEEVHHLGDFTNEDIARAIRDGSDARALVHARPVGSDASGQLVDPRSGQRRLIHQSGKTWRTVNTEDIHEKNHVDEKGELVTETARTKQQEQFTNVMVPDDGEEIPEGGQEASRSSSHHRRHTKDVDMLEYYSVPKGGRIGQGIKLGEGLRYVQENVEGERDGDDNIESLSERMKQLRQLGYKPEGQVLAKTPIEYQEEEKTKRLVTDRWLESHFAKGDSGSSDDDTRKSRIAKDSRRSDGVDEVDHRRETNTYQYESRSGTTRKGSAPPKTWSTSEKYTKNVRETPEHTYITETRKGPKESFERTHVLPAIRAPGKPSDLNSEMSEDPIFNSKFSTGKPQRSTGVRFQSEVADKTSRWEETGGLSPPTQSPPPPPPPRHRKKGRDTQSPPTDNNNHYASSPIRERYQRELSPSESREYRRQIEDSYQSHASHAKEYRSGSTSRNERYRTEYETHRDGSDNQRRRLGDSEERRVRHDQLDSTRHHSFDQLDNRYESDRSQTLPRRPNQHPPVTEIRAPDTNRFGGSLINVSSKPSRSGPPMPTQKPPHSSVQRSNSLYDRDGMRPNEAFSVGLKSPDIISKVQRSTLRRGDGDLDRSRGDGRESHTSSSTPSYTQSGGGQPRPRPGDTKKENFMRGLKKTAPDLFGVLHGDDDKRRSPKDSPPMTPPPPLQRAHSPGQRMPGVRRVERLRDDDDEHSRSRSYTPPEDTYRSSTRPSIVKVQR